MSTTYTAVVSREGDDWLAEVPGLPGAHAYARTLEALHREMTDAVVLAADLDDDAAPDIQFTTSTDDLEWIHAVGQRLAEAMATGVADLQAGFTLRMARDELKRLTDMLNSATTQWVQANQATLSTRDMAGAVGISPGRISQLVHS